MNSKKQMYYSLGMWEQETRVCLGKAGKRIIKKEAKRICKEQGYTITKHVNHLNQIINCYPYYVLQQLIVNKPKLLNNHF